MTHHEDCRPFEHSLPDPRLCREDFSDEQNYYNDLDRYVERALARAPRYSIVYASEPDGPPQTYTLTCVEMPWPPSASGPAHHRKVQRQHQPVKAVPVSIHDRLVGYPACFIRVDELARDVVQALWAACGLGAC